MKKNETKNSHLKLLPPLDITSEREVVYSHFGHPSHALITMPDQETARANKLRQLSALLKFLENEVATLQFKLLEVCSTLSIDIEDLRVEPSASTIDTIGTDVIE